MASPRKPKAVATPEAVIEVAAFTYSLESVIEATKEDSFVYTCAAFHNPLIESGDVIVNRTLENESGDFATRATAKHLNQNESTEMTTEQAPATQSTTTSTPVRVFEIKTGEIPASTRRTGGVSAGRKSIYPFDALEVAQYFFVPDAGEKVAVTSMASTVTGANARYAEVVEGQTRVNRKGVTVPVTRQLRKFKLFDGSEMIDGVEVKGAKVFRVPVDTAE